MRLQRSMRAHLRRTHREALGMHTPERFDPNAPDEGPTASNAPSHPTRIQRTVHMTAGGGYGVGSVLAMVICWTEHQSVIWTLVHGVFSWLSVAYQLLTHDGWTWL